MAKKRKQPTPMQQAYKKEVARIKRSIRNIEKRGYFFQELPNLELPKRVTKQALTKLQNTKAKDLYNLTVKVDYSTGELIPGKEARKIEYQERAQKAKQTRKQKQRPKNLDEFQQQAKKREEQFNKNKNIVSIEEYTKDEIDQFPDFSDIIIENFKDELTHFPTAVKQIFNTWIDETSKIYGTSEIAEQIANAKERGLIDYSAYGSGDEMAKYVISQMTKALPNFTKERKQQLDEAMEFIEDWNGLIED